MKTSLQSQNYKISGHKFSGKKVNHRTEKKNYKSNRKFERLNLQRKVKMRRKNKKFQKQIEEFVHREVNHLRTNDWRET